MSSSESVIRSCELSQVDWRNSINKYSTCGCREKWENIKRLVSESDAESDRYKQIINKATGNRDIHIIRCGHVWYGVK